MIPYGHGDSGLGAERSSVRKHSEGDNCEDALCIRDGEKDAGPGWVEEAREEGRKGAGWHEGIRLGVGGSDVSCVGANLGLL